MPDIAPIGPGSLGPVGRDTAVGRSSGGNHSTSATSQDVAAAGARASDRVELSDRARWLDQLQTLPPVRRDLVERLRGEIENGNYPSDDQLATALDRLLTDLEG